MRIHVLDIFAGAAITALIATPAFAITAAPAPVAGIGFGAAALFTYGYRALKNKIGR